MSLWLELFCMPDMVHLRLCGCVCACRYGQIGWSIKFVGVVCSGSGLIPYPSSPSLLGTQRCLSEHIT